MSQSFSQPQHRSGASSQFLSTQPLPSMQPFPSSSLSASPNNPPSALSSTPFILSSSSAAHASVSAPPVNMPLGFQSPNPSDYSPTPSVASSTSSYRGGSSNVNGHHSSDDDSSYDDESGVPSLNTLSSAEAQFDRLLQSIHHRDRAKFASYVRAEVEKESQQAEMMISAQQRAHKGAAGGILDSLPLWWRMVFDRFFLLAGLLFLQSCSSLILSHFSEFIQRHVIVTLYLTMLVGAGGNCGNQAAVLVIRLLATSTRRLNPLQIMMKELQVAFVLGILMVVVGFARVFLFEGGNFWAAFSITASLWCIVTMSVVLGTALPLALHQLKFDPAHAGPIIQVIMDVLGVAITCWICRFILTDEHSVNLPGFDIGNTGGHTIAG